MNVPNLHGRYARMHRGLVITGLIGAALAIPTIAFASPCPPGYHGSSSHCVPDQAPYGAKAMQSHAHVSGAVPMHTSKTYANEPKMADWHKTGPAIGPAPVEHHAGAASQHGIIFVGGKSSLNAQPIPPGKAALNPQPIPPGHAARRLPHAGAPIEKPAGH